ncbi:MAG: TolC family protein, partial [bacterium]|nr:TolC family protein [bacterium]
RLEAERLEAERLEAERLEAERLEAEQKTSQIAATGGIIEEVTEAVIEGFVLGKAATGTAAMGTTAQEAALKPEVKRKIVKEELVPDLSADSLNKEGVNLVKSGGMEEAVLKFTEALELDPSHIGARFNLAFTYQRMERLEEAESEYSKLLEIEDLARAHLMLGLLYKEEGKDSNAINEFEIVLRKEPYNQVAATELKSLRSNVKTEKAAHEKIAETAEKRKVVKEETVQEKYSLAGLIGMSEISVLADVEGHFTNSMAKNQILEGEFAIQVDETGLLESIRTGRSFNRESRAALARIEQAKAQTDQAKALLLPSVSVRASHGEETSEPSVVPDANNNLVSDTHMRTDASLTITQPLYNLPTFLDWRRRQAREQARRESYRVSDGDAYISTVDTYLSLVSSRLQADVMRDFAAKLADLLSYIEKRAAAGAASVSDMSRVRARSQQALSSRLEHESAHAAAGTEFVRLTNIVPQKVRLPKLEDIGHSFLPESFDMSVTTAMQSNPEIATLVSELKAEKISKAAAEGRYLPTVEAEYTDTYSDHAGGSDDSQRDKRLMLVMNWKLLSGGKDYKYNVERIARYKELEYRLDDERRRVVQALAANYAELATTGERIAAGYEELESLSIAVEAMSKRMLSGDQSLLDLLTVYDNYYKLRSRLIGLHILEMNTAAQLIRLTLGAPWSAAGQTPTSAVSSNPDEGASLGGG